MTRLKDLSDDRFGRLIALEPTERRASDRSVIWRCRCECGNASLVSSMHLRRGTTTSCGCYRLERMTGCGRDGLCRHKGTHPLYKTWDNMLQRCRNPNHPQHKDYGGRGIAVCDRWQGPDGFVNFAADMGDKPSPSLTLDRMNNDGNYEPDNCRWATYKQQANNRRPKKRRATDG